MTRFERCPTITLTVIVLSLCSVMLVGVEWGARTFFGLGNVVLYDTHPLYGYRPQPHQHVLRKKNVVAHTNNLGLRAENDWDLTPHKKILFLGDSVTYGGSYISNNELFSHLSAQALPGWEAGNAGVNGWGVSNVYAFVKTTGFLHADIYVSVFPEGDFYRGVNRIGGQPFWTVAPRFALGELFQYGVYQLQLRKNPPTDFYSETHPASFEIVQDAVHDLKALDDYLKSHQKQHFIYITPSRNQVLQQASHDLLVKSLLEKEQLNVTYISDRLPDVSLQEKEKWFHDPIHLSNSGHAVWATIMASDLTEKASS